ncbi:uncharacterized protein RBU33_008011 isoform 1-T1 [Hipposideros larvatus]
MGVWVGGRRGIDKRMDREREKGKREPGKKGEKEGGRGERTEGRGGGRRGRRSAPARPSAGFAGQIPERRRRRSGLRSSRSAAGGRGAPGLWGGETSPSAKGGLAASEASPDANQSPGLDCKNSEFGDRQIIFSHQKGGPLASSSATGKQPATNKRFDLAIISQAESSLGMPPPRRVCFPDSFQMRLRRIMIRKRLREVTARGHREEITKEFFPESKINAESSNIFLHTLAPLLV